MCDDDDSDPRESLRHAFRAPRVAEAARETLADRSRSVLHGRPSLLAVAGYVTAAFVSTHNQL
jgi:hypothetical protein